MWLEKFIFYGRSVGPTNAYLPAAELLANGVRFPLGRYLLSSTYLLLHQVSQKLLLGEPIGNLGGPWWFINMWLNAHIHKRLQWDFFAQQFLRDIVEDYELRDFFKAFTMVFPVIIGPRCPTSTKKPDSPFSLISPMMP
jgi:hypothetical protein